MIKKLILIIGGSLILVNLALNIWLLNKTSKIAYVRSQDLVYGYLGMKEVQNKFQTQSQLWQANLDTLKMDYKKTLNRHKDELDQLSGEEMKMQERILKIQENNIIQYSDAISSKARQQEEKMLEGVLNQVNSFILDYGKEKGYDVILGTTLSGSVLYGKDAIDITDELLDALNRNYQGEK